MCIPGTGDDSRVGIGAGVAWPLPLLAEPKSSRLCWGVTFAERDAPMPPETFQVGRCRYRSEFFNQSKSQTYLSHHNISEFRRVFESKVNYLFIISAVFLKLSVTVIHIGIVKNLVIRIEGGERG